MRADALASGSLESVAAVLTAILNGGGSGSGKETVIGKELKKVRFGYDY
jgi:Flp pilus assembly CpaF family ATPase